MGKLLPALSLPTSLAILLDLFPCCAILGNYSTSLGHSSFISKMGRRVPISKADNVCKSPGRVWKAGGKEDVGKWDHGTVSSSLLLCVLPHLSTDREISNHSFGGPGPSSCAPALPTHSDPTRQIPRASGFPKWGEGTG